MLSRMYNDHRNRHENSEDLSFKLHSRLLHSRSNNNSIELSLWGLKRRIVQSVFFRVEGKSVKLRVEARRVHGAGAD